MITLIFHYLHTLSVVTWERRCWVGIGCQLNSGSGTRSDCVHCAIRMLVATYGACTVFLALLPGRTAATGDSRPLIGQAGQLFCWVTNDNAGILTQDAWLLEEMLPPELNTTTTYLAASYVKWVEAAGGRAVPIIVDKEEPEYFSRMFAGIRCLTQVSVSRCLCKARQRTSFYLLYSHR